VSDLDVVTGAFSFTGRYIAEELLARGRRMRTLTRQPHPSHPLAGKVDAAPLVENSERVGCRYASELARNFAS
jgi:NADH dehydrogenase